MSTQTRTTQTRIAAARPVDTVIAVIAVIAGADAAAIAGVPRREHRARDFGVGYGSSSGYAADRRYADNWGNARFICG
ncbi:MAG: hypothetical protein ACREO8_13860 [Luteimonas sp.]